MATEKDNIYGKCIHGWFSVKASYLHDYIVYYELYNGTIVEVSSVTQTSDDSKTAFDDIKYIGQLKRHVRTIKNTKKITIPQKKLCGSGDS